MKETTTTDSEHVITWKLELKKLSADDIHEVANQFLKSYDIEKEVLVAIEDWYGFARAILKKASEK